MWKRRRAESAGRCSFEPRGEEGRQPETCIVDALKSMARAQVITSSAI